MSDSTKFISFTCSSCHQEIEVGRELEGQIVECPACGVRIKVEAPEQGPTQAQLDAMKSRTIRIEIGDL